MLCYVMYEAGSNDKWYFDNFFYLCAGTKIQQQAQKAAFKSVLVPNLTKNARFFFLFSSNAHRVHYIRPKSA